jgi:hypothetical protein
MARIKYCCPYATGSNFKECLNHMINIIFSRASSAQMSLSCRQTEVETEVATRLTDQGLHSGSYACAVLLSRVICDIHFQRPIWGF